MFADAVDDTRAELEKHYSDRNIKEYTIKVHALKSSARIIGATDLADSAQALEDAGKRGDERFISENHEASDNE